MRSNVRVSVRTAAWPPGVPCWIELRTPDPAAAGQVYGEIFGWEILAGAGGRIATRQGAAVAGLASGDGAAAWVLFVATDDVVATAAAVESAAGRVLVPPRAKAGGAAAAATAILQDPGGAVFGAWQAGSRIGACRVNEPGALVWEDLSVPEPQRCRQFYGAVFGWTFPAMPEAGEDYSLVMGEDPFPLGGLGRAAPGAPAAWLVYLGVASADDAVAGMVGHGGSVVMPAADGPYGRRAVLTDPWGARVAVIETDPSRQPDRSG